MQERRSTGAVVTLALAVLGCWLAIMPPAVLAIALRMREFDPSGLPTQYAATLAAGWLAMIVGLIGFGMLGDLLERRGDSRIVLVRIAIPAVLVLGLLLSIAESPTQLLVAWVLLQMPAAAIVTSALAMSGSIASPSQRGVLSGLVGAASIVALLIGSLLVRALQADVSTALLVTSALGAAMAVPLALRRARELGTPREPSERRAAPGGAARRVPAWIVFTVASILLSWATSTANGFIVPFFQYLTSTPAGEIADASTRAVTFATLAAIVSSIAIGFSLGRRRWVAWLWSVAAAIVAVAIAGLLAAPTPVVVLAFTTLLGAGFGAANGVELSLLLSLRHSPGSLGRDLGFFNAMTSVPYVLVPAVATAWLATDTATGLRGMFTLAWVLALAGAAVTAGIAVFLSRRSR